MAKPKLNIVKPGDNPASSPPRPLGPAGQSLWTRITNEYAIHDSGGMELLCLAGEALDRADQLAEVIKRDGPMITGRNGPRENPCLRQELANRTFVSSCLLRLGINLQ